MTGFLLAAGAGDDPISAAVREAPIELRLEDSLKSIAAPVRNASAAMVGVLIGSLAVHAVILMTALISNRAIVVPPQQEIAVEVVQDTPKPVAPPKPAKAVEPAKPPAPAKKPDLPKIQQAHLELTKPEPPKLEPPKPTPTKIDPPKPEAATQQPPLAPVAKPLAETKEVAALEKELADLRYQRAALRTASQESLSREASSQEASSQEPRMAQGGPLAGSLQAIAMPSIGAAGEVEGYQELVFSALAKAKGVGEYRGRAGSTGVHFEVDVEGHLLHAEVATSSGSPDLDKEALDIVRRAAPFPPPPKDADHSFFANVNFRPPKA